MPEEVEVTILDRTFITTYPRLRQAVRTSITTYLAPDMPPRTVRINLTELFGEQVEEAEQQIKAGAGDLWGKFKAVEDKAIAEDIKAFRAFKPEVKRITLS